MNDHRPESVSASPVQQIVRGFILGLVGVIAIAVWAVNFEPVLRGDTPGGPWGTILRVFLCDAVPLATLLAIYRGISRNHNLEQVVFGIVRTMFWLRPAPTNELHREQTF